jgi:hypothetical protein
MEKSYGLSSGKFEFIGTSFMLALDHYVTLCLLAKRLNPEKLLFRPPVPPPEITLSA